MIGQTIGKYRITARLGRGGMGIVYKAIDETLEREVAIKVLDPDIADQDVLKRFRAEAITLAKLSHPNIATVYELARHDDNLLLIIEYVRGETLDRLSERAGPLPVERAVYLIGQVLDALGYAHRAGIVHRDLKPANLMLTESGIVKVMDFGIARVAGTERLTTSGYMMGTPAYMAPEQVLGDEVDGRADLYAIGVVLYRLLTGKLPFKADTAIAMVQKQIKDQPTPVRQVRAELPDWCEEILNRALAKAPADRFQTADEFRTALARRTALVGAADITGLAGTPDGDLEVTVAPQAMMTPVRQAPDASASSARVAPAPEQLSTNVERARTPAAPAPHDVTVTFRRSHLAAAGALAAILLLIGAGTFVWLANRGGGRTAVHVFQPNDAGARPVGSSAAPDTPEPAPEKAGEAPSANADRASVTSSTPTQPAASAPADTAASRSAADVTRTAETRRTTTGTAVRTAAAKTAAEGAEPGADDSGASPASTPAAPDAAPAAAPVPTIAFSGLKLLTLQGGNPREQDSALRLGGTQLDILDSTGNVAVAVPYEGILEVFHSRSREPRWRGPAGHALPVGRTAEGGFSPLRGTPDWLTIRTKQQFIPLRSPGAILQRVIAALEQRIGRSVIRVGR